VASRSRGARTRAGATTVLTPLVWAQSHCCPCPPAGAACAEGTGERVAVGTARPEDTVGLTQRVQPRRSPGVKAGKRLRWDRPRELGRSQRLHRPVAPDTSHPTHDHAHPSFSDSREGIPAATRPLGPYAACGARCVAREGRARASDRCLVRRDKGIDRAVLTRGDLYLRSDGLGLSSRPGSRRGD
jgi:hypothetical protein